MKVGIGKLLFGTFVVDICRVRRSVAQQARRSLVIARRRFDRDLGDDVADQMWVNLQPAMIPEGAFYLLAECVGTLRLVTSTGKQVAVVRSPQARPESVDVLSDHLRHVNGEDIVQVLTVLDL